MRFLAFMRCCLMNTEDMEITRVNTYQDGRFSEKVLRQHGAFLVNGKPCEVEIISGTEAVIRGAAQYQKAVIEEFRFYAEHICKFYDGQGNPVAEYAPVKLFDVPLSAIQPSQFFVDQEKKAAVSTFVHCPGDIVIPLIPKDGRFISLDGHTRLSIAADKGFTAVGGFLTEGDDWVYAFAAEANRRGIHSVFDMTELSRQAYEIQWVQFCDQFFSSRNAVEKAQE